MFKYEYVTIEAKGFSGKNFKEYRTTIDSYAQKGYRYVGFVPTKEPSLGISSFPQEIDLIFEMQEK